MCDLSCKIGNGAGFLQVLRFPLPIFIQTTASNPSSGTGMNSGLRTKLTLSHPTPKIKVLL
jgi:hypothetical protein